MNAVRILLALAILPAVCSDAPRAAETQPDSAAPQLIDPNLNEIQNEFLNQQAQALLGLADETLTRHPPQLPAASIPSWSSPATRTRWVTPSTTANRTG